MRRSHLFALAALLAVTPALGQSIQVRPIQRPIPTLPAPEVVQPQDELTVQQDADPAAKAMTVEEAQAQIRKLRLEKRELDSRLKQALADIEQMTSRTGSLVRAYCESRTLSRNTAGASENCAASGYTCAEVSGLCKTSCSISPDCSTGFTCMPDGRCVRTG